MDRPLSDESGPPATVRRAILIGWTLARHVGVFLGTLLGAVVVVHLLFILAPGDAIDALPNAAEVRPVLEAEWHLNRSAPEQVLSYLVDLVQGDLRTSLVYRPGQPVWQVVAGPALRSLGLLLTALFCSVFAGVGLAAWTSGRTSLARPAVWALSLFPVFLVARVMVALMNGVAWELMQQELIARPGWFALPIEEHPVKWALAVTILAVGSGALAEIHGESESLFRRIRGSGYVEAARARGARVWPHVLRNLAPPLTSVIASRTAFFVGGLVILERILNINGVGAILWRAALERDYPLALGITLITAGTVALAKLLGDVARTTLDPRRRGTP
ncbi:MAG: ABC transporter permease [Myxococcota bacterium]